jgi:enoyl-CoA hydratase
MEEYLITKHSTGILQWTINRPTKRNAINYNVMAGLEKVLNQAINDHEVKALVISGSGDQAFCSGGDLAEFHKLKTEEQSYRMLSKMGLLLFRLATLPKPTLALLNGPAVGGGCEIATACDFRIAKAGSVHGFIQGTLAITTGWGGASLLYEKLPPADALKLLSESKRMDAAYLMQLGFIHEIFSSVNMDHAYTYLSHILDTHQSVLSAYKKTLVSKWTHTNLKQRILEEIRQCAILWEKEEHHLAVQKFLAK